jgi:hypothetical protein
LGGEIRRIGRGEVKTRLNMKIEIMCSSRDLIGHLPGLTGRGCQTDSIVQ